MSEIATIVREDALQVVVEATAPVIPVVVASAPTISTVIGLQGAAAIIPEGTYLEVAQRLGEFDTAQKKAEARANLELQYIDGGTF